MADFNIRSESVDVEQIMKQIRSRIREKRGVDYTEEQVRELATVRLEKFLDPKNLRSDLLEQFRRSRPAVPSEAQSVEPPYTFSDETLYETHRGSLRFIRKLLHPLLKLLFNPNPLIHVLHKQVEFNEMILKRDARRKIEFDKSRAEWNALYYEVLHNLVLETTRSGIEIKNLKMRVEALASRLDFSERRVRALEGVVQYRPEAVRPREPRESREQREPRDQREPREPREPRDQRESRPRPSSPTYVEPRPEVVPEGVPAADAGDAVVAGQPAPATGEGARRRRRRRRGRRGAGMPPGGAPATAGEQAGAGEGQGDDSADADQDADQQGDAGFDGEGADEGETALEAAGDRADDNSNEGTPDTAGSSDVAPRDEDEQ
jgi:hypothetical protein